MSSDDRPRGHAGIRCAAAAATAGPERWPAGAFEDDRLEVEEIAPSGAAPGWARDFGTALRLFRARPDIVLVRGGRLAILASLIRIASGLAPFPRPLPLVVAYDFPEPLRLSGFARRLAGIATSGIYLFVLPSAENRDQVAAALAKHRDRFLAHRISRPDDPGARSGGETTSGGQLRWLLVNLGVQKQTGTLIFRA